VHAALLLFIVLMWTPWASPQAGTEVFRVRGEFLDAPPGGSPDGGTGSGPEGLNFSNDSPGGSFADDEGGANVQPDAPATSGEFADSAEDGAPGGRAGSGLSVQGALAAVVSERPPVNFSALLPGHSAGTDERGIGNARGLTSGSAPSNKLGKGGYASTSVFGAGGEGYKFVYVFDRSGSMSWHGGAPLRAAKAQLLKSLSDLGQTHQFQIVFYSDHPSVFNPTGVLGRLVFANEQNKYAAEQFVKSIVADGATEHEEALHFALRLAPDVIFFLTDADEPRLNSDQLLRIQRLNHGTCINCIEFGYGAQGDADNFLVRLARENYGKHVYVDVGRLGR